MGHDLLAGRTAIITGAGQGIGLALARAYIEEGARVALFERSAAALETALMQLGDHAAGYTVDVTDSAAAAAAVAAVVRLWGRLDVLVNNAGVFRSGTILEDTLDDWRFVLGVNLEGVYWLSKQAAQAMVGQGGGRIVNISSISGGRSRGNCGSYNASKGGVSAFTKSLAVELAPYTIQVNAIAPGFVRTAQMQDADGGDLTQSSTFLAWYSERGRIPMRRAGEPDEIASTAVFLASDYCRYMTGQVLVVDGGLTSTF